MGVMKTVVLEHQ